MFQPKSLAFLLVCVSIAWPAILRCDTPPEAADPRARKVTQLAPGIYAIRHQRNPGGDSGNTTVIIGDNGVFVVDSCILTSAAQEDIAQIRQWTQKPVRYLLNTHWHGDHNFGNSAYMAGYPTLEIIAQEETKKDMDLLHVSLRKFAAESVTSTIPAYKSGKYADGTPLPPEQVKSLPAIVATLEKDVQEYKTNTYQGPTLTFKNELDVDLGNVDVKVMFLGRGHTNGDAVVYLPKQRILITGDLVVSPLPFFYSGYPSEFVKTLEKLAQFDADTIVPGHGEIEHDTKYLSLIHDFLKSAVDQVNARLAVAGPAVFLTLDQVKGNVDLSSFKQRFIGSNSALSSDFDDMAANAVKLVFTEASLR